MPLQWFSTRSNQMDWPSCRPPYWYVPVIEPLQPFLIPLRFAHHPQITGAGEGIRHSGGWAFHAEDDRVVIDDLHLFHGPPDASKRGDRLGPQHESVGMNHILGGKLAEPEVEGDPLAQGQRPLFHIGARFPLLRQARRELAGLGIQVQQGLQVGVILELMRATGGPEAIGFVDPSGGKN
jgi:hypothetical protein